MRQEDLLTEIRNLRRRVAEFEHVQARLASMEQALLESEERFRLLYENASFGCQSLDEEGRIAEVNPAWLESLGYSREEVSGPVVRGFSHPCKHAEIQEDFFTIQGRGRVSGGRT